MSSRQYHVYLYRMLTSVRIDHIWTVLALCIIGVFISLVPTGPNDFWWHLKVGQLTATTGTIPTSNLFAWTLPADTPYIYQSWLGEWLFYALYHIGGFPLVIFARNMLGLLAFTFVAGEAQRRSGSWRLAAGATFLAAAMSINNLATRTQNWSWVPFTLVLLIFSSYIHYALRPRWLLLLPLIMVFWVNMHGAFVMGLLIAGAFVVGETLQWLLRLPHALDWSRLRYLYTASIAMLLATLANPLGIHIFTYVQTLLQDAPSQRLINEWQSPTPRTLAGACFYIGILFVIAAFAFARTRPRIADVLIVCGLAWQAFIGVRYVVWFGMAAMPIAVQCFAKDTPRQPVKRRGSIPNLIIAGLLACSVLAFQPWFKSMIPLPEPYTALFAPMLDAPLMFSADTPVAAAEYLRENPCQGRLFNEMGYGSYLDWALYPDTQVFIDPRVELYPMTLWEDYVALTKGVDVERLLNKPYQEQSISCVLLDKKLQPRLAEAMATLPGWERTYTDERSEVWRRW